MSLRYGTVPVLGSGAYKTPFGLLLPPSSNVAAYVHSDPPAGLPRSVRTRIVPTLESALAKVHSGLGDVVICLPGHTQNVSDSGMLDNLVDGTRILGLGHGSMQPKFTWTETDSSWVIDDNDVVIQGFQFVSGANGVTKAFDITGNNCAIEGNRFFVAPASDEHAEIVCEVGSGADNCRIAGNRFLGITGEPITDGILVDAAVNDMELHDNVMMFASTTGTTASLIRITAAVNRAHIARNTLSNMVADSDHCIVIGNVAATGVVEYNTLSVLTNDTPATSGISLGGAAAVHLHENYCTTNAQASGALSPAADS